MPGRLTLDEPVTADTTELIVFKRLELEDELDEELLLDEELALLRLLRRLLICASALVPVPMSTRAAARIMTIFFILLCLYVVSNRAKISKTGEN